jgi:hypothetical protein
LTGVYARGKSVNKFFQRMYDTAGRVKDCKMYRTMI